jgi:hypothetical protein
MDLEDMMLYGGVGALLLGAFLLLFMLSKG